MSVRPSFRQLIFCRYLLLGFTTQELHTFTFWSPWSKVVHLQFSDGSRQKFSGNWRKKNKNQFFEIFPIGLISMPNESFWSEVVYLTFSGRSRQKFGGNWQKHVILCPYLLCNLGAFYLVRFQRRPIFSAIQRQPCGGVGDNNSLGVTCQFSIFAFNLEKKVKTV